jgi:kumamolisin
MVDRRSALMRLAAMAATAGVMCAGATTASAASGAHSTVAQGVDPGALPGSTVFGKTPPSTPETVSFIMRENNLAQLEASVTHGVGSYLSVGQFAAQYGGDPTAIHKLQTYLAGYGITTSVDGDQVDVVATGTAGEFDQALDVQQDQYHVPAQSSTAGQASVPAQTVHGTPDAPQLPSAFASDVLAVLGLSNYSAFTSNAKHADGAVHGTDKSTPTSCEKQLPNSCNLPQNFASDYGLDPLYDDGADGQGQTIGIVTLAALDPGAPQYFWQNVAHIASTGRTVTTVDVQGGPGKPNLGGSGETDLDVEQSGGVAPGANVIVYQAANTDSGFAGAFFQAASDDVADSVSSSWGESETIIANQVAKGREPVAYEAAFDEAFLEMAAQGQSGFIASGDNGAYDASDDIGTTNLSIDANGDSPYITSAGATTLAGDQTFQNANRHKSVTVDVPAERMWGWDYLWAPVAAVTPGHNLNQVIRENVWGGGGGFSKLYAQPSYQQGVSGTSSYSAVPYLTPTEFLRSKKSGIVWPHSWSINPSPSVTTGTASGRATPDLATDGDPDTGYWLYPPTAKPALENGWGGTSFVAPQLNGATAVIDSYAGHRVGFWNPAMYDAASSAHSPFTPLDQSGSNNDNVYYTGTPGAVFDAGAGLGTPDLSALATVLAADSPH